KRQWKITVTDPDEGNAKRASFEITMLGDGTFAQPVQAHIVEVVESLPELTGIDLTQRIPRVRPPIPNPAPPFTPGQDSLAAASAMLAEAQRTPPVPATFGQQ
ncbi:hypothetical protein ACFQ1S_21945, partial [Kibdelosporangium lantanae]